MLNTLDLFSGIGCFSYAFKGTFRTIAYCEIDEDCRHVLIQNMKKGLIDTAPILNDVRTVTRSSLTKRVDVIYAGFPCQDISVANINGRGLRGDRSGLFYEILRIVDDLPSVSCIMLENVGQFLNKGYKRARSLLKERGFAVRCVIVSARQLGAPHTRKRIFIWAQRGSERLPQLSHEISTKLWKKEPQRIDDTMIGRKYASDSVCAATQLYRSVSKRHTTIWYTI